MQRIGVRRRFVGLLFGGLLCGAMSVLDGCSHAHNPADDSVINVYPANYRAEILAGMHAYLNDPTGIRDPGVAEPVIKTIGNDNRYLACVRFNGKRRGNEYAGVREIGAVFVSGRFDRFIETVREPCAGIAYTPFPELGKLSR
jgi:hypothetical protein